MREIINLVEQQSFFHVTKPEFATAIRADGFISSKSGELGPGVYLIDNPDGLEAERFRGGEVLQVSVQGNLAYDKIPDRRRPQIWDTIHKKTSDAGYVGIELQHQPGYHYKSTVVFDPSKITVFG